MKTLNCHMTRSRDEATGSTVFVCTRTLEDGKQVQLAAVLTAEALMAYGPEVAGAIQILLALDVVRGKGRLVGEVKEQLFTSWPEEDLLAAMGAAS